MCDNTSTRSPTNQAVRLALIGSTALRIDTPDSDLDVVVYTCIWLADSMKSQASLIKRSDL